MARILLIENEFLLTDYLKNLSPAEDMHFIGAKEPEEAIGKLYFYKPDVILLDENLGISRLLDICKTVREKYSLVVPIFLVIDFYSSTDLSAFKNLGIEVISKPFSFDDLKEKLFMPFISEPQISISKIVPEITSHVSKVEPGIPTSKESEELEILEKLKPYIKEEIERQLATMFKKLTEVLEKRYV